MRVAFVTPSYDGADRCRFLLDTWKENDPASFGRHPHVICADYAMNRPLRDLYHPMEEENEHVHVVYRDATGCCDGASRTAIETALAAHDPKWVVLLSDDLAIPPEGMSSLLYFLYENPLEQVGGIQPPFWHCCPEPGLEEKLRTDEPRYFPGLPRTAFYESREWTRTIPRNPFFDNPKGIDTPPGFAFPYYSFGGWAMVVRASTYQEVGGIPEGSWRYDETLAYRIWTRSLRSIIALPGPPVVHYMGGGFAQGPRVDPLLGDEPHYCAATGAASIPEAMNTITSLMNQRAPVVREEMAACKYWDTREEQP